MLTRTPYLSLAADRLEGMSQCTECLPLYIVSTLWQLYQSVDQFELAFSISFQLNSVVYIAFNQLAPVLSLRSTGEAIPKGMVWQLLSVARLVLGDHLPSGR